MDKPVFWVGNWGTYPMPEKYLAIPVNKYGYPDRRYKMSEEILEWVRNQEDQARARIHG